MKRNNDLAKLYVDMRIDTDWVRVAQAVRDTIERVRLRYERVEARTKVPWKIIAAIHWMEASGNFGCHLHNGDSLKARTRRVPAGRPRYGKPPFAWEDSAVDALEYDGLAKHPWGKDRTADLLKIELFNGPGYRNRKLNSPYLFSGCQHYDCGKYVADGKWSSTAVSKQLGAACILRMLGW
jgi:lysozyme family protein